MSSFKTKKSEQTFHRVLNSSIELFTKLGFEKTTMRAISKEARLGLGALYYYFPSKEAIVVAFYEELNKEVATAFQEQNSPEDSLNDQLKLLLELKLEALRPYRDLVRVLMREAVDPDSALSPISGSSRRALDTSMSSFVELAGEHGPSAARVLWLGHLAVIGLWVHRPERVKQAIDSFCDLAPMLALAVASGALAGSDDLLCDLIPIDTAQSES